MNIRYSDGTKREAVLLGRSAKVLRVAIRGSEDATELAMVNGTWVTDDCEPVHVEYAWEAPTSQTPVTEADCICPPELAYRLIRILYSQEEEMEQAASACPVI